MVAKVIGMVVTWLSFGLFAANTLTAAELNLRSSLSDLIDVRVGETLTFTVELEGLGAGIELDALGATVVYDAVAFSPRGLISGPIVPLALNAAEDFRMISRGGVADATFLTFGTQAEEHIASEGVFYTFNLRAVRAGEGVIDFDFVGATQFNASNPENPLEISLTTSNGIAYRTVNPPDFNLDGVANIQDVDALVGEILAGTHDPLYDLSGDNLVNRTDLTRWLDEAAFANGWGQPYLLGDANLDGIVNFQDFSELGNHWQQSVIGWSKADFDASRRVDFSDFSEMGNRWQQSIAQTSALPSAVPEPAVPWWMALVLLGMRTRGRYS